MRNSPIDTFRRRQAVKVLGVDAAGETTSEDAVIVRPQPMTHYGTGEDYPGWYHVRFADGARLVIHAERMIGA